MKRVAVCLKPQSDAKASGYTMWRQFPFGVEGVRTLNYALNLKTIGDVELIAFIMAPIKYREKITLLGAWGFSRIVYISDLSIAGADSLGTSVILSRAVERYKCDFVVIGRKSEDSSTGQVPIQMAMALGARMFYDNEIDIAMASQMQNIVVAVGKNYPEIFPSLSMIIKGERTLVDVLSLVDLELEGEKIRFTKVVEIKDVNKLQTKNEKKYMSADDAKEFLSSLVEL